MAVAAVRHYRRALRRERLFRDRLNPLENLSEVELITKYRFPGWAIQRITDIIEENVAHPSSKSGALPALLQVCVSLRYLASGSFQDSIGEHIGVHQTTVSRSFHRVINALVDAGPQFIRKPNQEEAQIQKRLFRDIAGIPDVFAAIDCTHIKVKAPVELQHEYINRKNTFSINTQAACDADLMFIDCFAQFPGSVHDARILRESGLYRAMERHPRAIQGIILGDSGYPIREWLITPFMNPQEQAEENFNTAHVLTRNIIERCFGILKKRFYSMQIGLRLYPDTACRAIYACFVLHNIAMALKVPLMDGLDHENAPEMPAIRYNQYGLGNASERAKTEAGKAIRHQIAHTFFE